MGLHPHFSGRITATDTSFATDIVEGIGIGGTNIVTRMTITRVLAAAAGSAVAVARIDGVMPASGAITKEEGSLRINNMGLISLPTEADQITTGIIDYANDVIRHYIVLNVVFFLKKPKKL